MSKGLLTIIQGVPGSGKSTIARALASCTPGVVICSADIFFMKGDEYVFEALRLPDVHRHCFLKAEQYMDGWYLNIIIDNCNILQEHCQPYINLASHYGYDIQFIEVRRYICGVVVLPPIPPEYYQVTDNVHNVPEHAIKRMIDQQERLVPVVK